MIIENPNYISDLMGSWKSLWYYLWFFFKILKIRFDITFLKQFFNL
jgi:hypothetical protein